MAHRRVFRANGHCLCAHSRDLTCTSQACTYASPPSPPRPAPNPSFVPEPVQGPPSSPLPRLVARLAIAVAEDNARGLIGRPNIEDRLAEVPRRLAAQMDLMAEITQERAAIAAQQAAADRQGTDEVDGAHPLQQALSHPLADITNCVLNVADAASSRLNAQEVPGGFRPFVVGSSSVIEASGAASEDEESEVEIVDERVADRVEVHRAPQARLAPPPPSPSPAVSTSPPLPDVSQVSLAGLAFSLYGFPTNPCFAG